MLNGLYRTAEFFRHTDPRVPRWIAFDAAKHLISFALVETWSLKCNRKQDGPGATAPERFVFRRADDAAADAMPAQAVGQEKQVDEQQAHRRPAEESADCLPTLGIGDQDGERA